MRVTDALGRLRALRESTDPLALGHKRGGPGP